MKSNPLVEIIYLFKHKDDYGNIRTIKDSDWIKARKTFIETLNGESRTEILEEAILNKYSWDLPIECKFKLLEKAKLSGCDSFEFWQDYYKYMATYLDPNDPNRPFALKMANGKYL